MRTMDITESWKSMNLLEIVKNDNYERPKKTVPFFGLNYYCGFYSLLFV